MVQAARQPVDEIVDARKGRPLQMEQQAREALILDAAEALLVEEGPNQTSMDAIARRAGMSKRTIYEMFRNRDHLLGACIARKSRAFLCPLGPEMEGKPLADRLRALLSVNCTPSYEEASLELLRAIIAQARKYPWLAKAAYEGGFMALQQIVEEELAAGVKRGEIAVPPDHLRETASILVAMVFESPIASLLDPEAFRNEAERNSRRDLAIEIFLKGLGRA